MFESDDITFRGNYVHHNLASGFWSDGSRGLLVEDNLFEDNGLVSIQLELSANGIVRRNAAGGRVAVRLAVDCARHAGLRERF